MTRTEILSRYRRLRQVSKEHHHAVLDIIAPDVGRSHPLDRYARAAQFSPDSDEALVLEAMRHARFSVWRVERRHETAGLILRDVLRGEETWLVDETMEKNPPLLSATIAPSSQQSHSPRTTSTNSLARA